MISLIPSPWKSVVPLEISTNIFLKCIDNVVIVMLWHFVYFVFLFHLKKEYVCFKHRLHVAVANKLKHIVSWCLLKILRDHATYPSRKCFFEVPLGPLPPLTILPFTLPTLFNYFLFILLVENTILVMKVFANS